MVHKENTKTMKATIAAFCLLFYSLVLIGQEVEDVIEFQLNTTAAGNEKIRILDASDQYVIVKVRSSDFSTNNGFSFQNEEATEVILFCDVSLNVLWTKAIKVAALHDAIIGSDGLYLYCGGGLGAQFLGEGVSIQKSAFVAKLDFNGDWIWVNKYGGVQRHETPDRSLALDGAENLILAASLKNYAHPAPIDTLVFMSDTCFCSAIDLQFPLCTTTLKWDTDGNEMAYHVLDSDAAGTTLDVGADMQGNYYVSGQIGFTWTPPLFNGSEVGSGEFVLKFGPDDSEKWVYSRSNQIDGYNSGEIGFIGANPQNAFFSVRHTTNEVVTDGNTIVLNLPGNGSVFSSYRTIHILDNQTGILDTLDFLGHISAHSPLELSQNGQVYTVESPALGFEHSFPPYAYTPNPADRLILSKEISGQYSAPVALEAISFNGLTV